LPIMVRIIFAIIIRKNLNDFLPEKENDRTDIRSYTLSLAGFTFAALIALVFIETKNQRDCQVPIYFVFISFIFYLFALNIQGYKSRRWHDLLSDTLLETASLCLIVTVISLLFITSLDRIFIYLISSFSILVWLTDFVIRVTILKHYYDKKKEN
ncbi:MAG: hypothetical protein ACTSUC_00355, partial [Promethearchaeota archaeon]